MHEVKILETTIRDGSYEVGFQFTLEDVARLGGLLDQAGFSYIEIAHGSGLGGAAFGEPAAFTDEEYLRVGRAAVKNAKLGALMGFNKRSEQEILDRVRYCADVGLDFVRMGFVPSNTGNPVILKAIKLAVELGLTVSANFMRTYCTTPAELANKAAALADIGVSWAYLVDSCGGMLPDQVKQFVAALKEKTNLVVGFHGHNNTQMAVANSLAAVEAGASMVDVSLQGLGRATGNAPTEIITTIFQERLEQELQIDRNVVYGLGRSMVRPWIRGGFDPTDVISGVYNVHSSCMNSVTKAAAKHGVRVDDLIREAARLVEKPTQLEGRDLPAELLEGGCAKLTAKGRAHHVDLAPIARHVAELTTEPQTLGELIAKLKVPALRDHKESLLVLVDAKLWNRTAVAVRGNWAIATLPVSDPAQVESIELEDWITRVYVDRRLDASLLPSAERTDFVDLIAQSLASGVTGDVAVRVEDPELKRALEGHLWRCEKSAGAGAVFVQSTGQIARFEKGGASVVADPLPLLVAQHQMQAASAPPPSVEQAMAQLFAE